MNVMEHMGEIPMKNLPIREANKVVKRAHKVSVSELG